MSNWADTRLDFESLLSFVENTTSVSKRVLKEGAWPLANRKILAPHFNLDNIYSIMTNEGDHGHAVAYIRVSNSRGVIIDTNRKVHVVDPIDPTSFEDGQVLYYDNSKPPALLEMPSEIDQNDYLTTAARLFKKYMRGQKRGSCSVSHFFSARSFVLFLEKLKDISIENPGGYCRDALQKAFDSKCVLKGYSDIKDPVQKVLSALYYSKKEAKKERFKSYTDSLYTLMQNVDELDTSQKFRLYKVVNELKKLGYSKGGNGRESWLNQATEETTALKLKCDEFHSKIIQEENLFSNIQNSEDLKYIFDFLEDASGEDKSKLTSDLENAASQITKTIIDDFTKTQKDPKKTSDSMKEPIDSIKNLLDQLSANEVEDKLVRYNYGKAVPIGNSDLEKLKEYLLIHDLLPFEEGNDSFYLSLFKDFKSNFKAADKLLDLLIEKEVIQRIKTSSQLFNVLSDVNSHRQIHKILSYINFYQLDVDIGNDTNSSRYILSEDIKEAALLLYLPDEHIFYKKNNCLKRAEKKILKGNFRKWHDKDYGDDIAKERKRIQYILSELLSTVVLCSINVCFYSILINYTKKHDPEKLEILLEAIFDEVVLNSRIYTVNKILNNLDDDVFNLFLEKIALNEMHNDIVKKDSSWNSRYNFSKENINGLISNLSDKQIDEIISDKESLNSWLKYYSECDFKEEGDNKLIKKLKEHIVSLEDGLCDVLNNLSIKNLNTMRPVLVGYINNNISGITRLEYLLEKLNTLGCLHFMQAFNEAFQEGVIEEEIRSKMSSAKDELDKVSTDDKDKLIISLDKAKKYVLSSDIMTVDKPCSDLIKSVKNLDDLVYVLDNLKEDNKESKFFLIYILRDRISDDFIPNASSLAKLLKSLDPFTQSWLLNGKSVLYSWHHVKNQRDLEILLGVLNEKNQSILLSECAYFLRDSIKKIDDITSVISLLKGEANKQKFCMILKPKCSMLQKRCYSVFRTFLDFTVLPPLALSLYIWSTNRKQIGPRGLVSTFCAVHAKRKECYAIAGANATASCGL